MDISNLIWHAPNFFLAYKYETQFFQGRFQNQDIGCRLVGAVSAIYAAVRGLSRGSLYYIAKSLRPKPLYWFRSDTKTETQSQ